MTFRSFVKSFVYLFIYLFIYLFMPISGRVGGASATEMVGSDAISSRI